MSETELSELLDVLDEHGEPTGKTKARADIHRDGDWHRSFHLWIIKEGRYVLFQRRAKEKDLEGGKIDVSVGGHYGAGETLSEVVREVEEELGLFVRPEQLAHIETRQVERHYEEMTDREFQETYVMRVEQALEHYFLNCREVTVLYEVPIDKAIDLYEKGQYVAAAGYDCQQRNNNALLIEDDLIQQAREDVTKTLKRIKKWLSEGDTE